MSRRRSSSAIPSRGSAAFRDLRRARAALLDEDSVIIGIDPSCGSSSSLPGYAIWEGGEITDTGVIDMPLSAELHERLAYLAVALRDEFPLPDVLVVEDIPPRRYGGGSATGHASLLRATGAIYAAREWPEVVRLKPRTWRAHRPADWVKGDAEDARALIYAARKLAELIPEPRKRGQGKQI